MKVKLTLKNFLNLIIIVKKKKDNLQKKKKESFLKLYNFNI